MKQILRSIIIFICLSSVVSANEVGANNAYLEFQKGIEDTYTPQTQEVILKRVQARLYDYSLLNHSIQKNNLLQGIIALNNEALFELGNGMFIENNTQKIRELLIIKELRQTLSQLTLPVDFEVLTNKPNISFQPTNSLNEYILNGEIYKLQYSKYFEVNLSTLRQLEAKSGIIVTNGSNGYRFIENFTSVKKIPYTQLTTEFIGLLTPDKNILEKNGYYYGYNYQALKYYEDMYGVYDSQLLTSGLSRSTDLMYIDEEGKYNFIKEYSEVKLLPVQEVYGISEKQLFLEYVFSDSKHESPDVLANINAIKKITADITREVPQEEKISVIYEWILENIEYSKVVNLSNTQIFSAGEAVKTGEGVCTAYAKLMVFMMLYSGFYDVRMIEGHVIDAQDFPTIGHAWVQYQDRFYDPTFDDPIGSVATKISSEYKYYDMPRDIFYANRFLYTNLPVSFETASKEQIQQYIFNYLSNLIPKYEGQLQKYEVFNEVLFRKNNNIGANVQITPEILANKIGFIEVNGEKAQFIKDGTVQQITNLQYYTIDPGNTELTLLQSNYNVNEFKLLKWISSDGTFDWRLAFNLQIR